MIQPKEDVSKCCNTKGVGVSELDNPRAFAYAVPGCVLFRLRSTLLHRLEKAIHSGSNKKDMKHMRSYVTKSKSHRNLA